MVRTYFVAGSLEAFELNGEVDVWDVDTTKSISMLNEVSRQYVVQDAAVVLDYLFLRACQYQPSVLSPVQEASPESEDC